MGTEYPTGMSSSSHRALKSPRSPLASYLLSFTYLVVPLVWIAGIGFCYVVSQLVTVPHGIIYFVIFCWWVIGTQVLLLFLLSRITAGLNILILRQFTGKASWTSAKIAQPFATYGYVNTVFRWHGSKDGFIFAAAALTDRNPFTKAIAGPMTAQHLFGDDDWETGVADLINKADIVVIDVLHGATNNILWEFRQCQQQLPNHRIIFLAPPEILGVPASPARITLRLGWPGSVSIRLRHEIYRVMKTIALAECRHSNAHT